MSAFGSGDLDLPYEPSAPGTTVDLSDAVVCGGVVTMAAVLPVPGVGPKPALVFRFAEATGVLHHPLVLVLEPKQMRELRTLIGDAADGAVRAAG